MIHYLLASKRISQLMQSREWKNSRIEVSNESFITKWAFEGQSAPPKLNTTGKDFHN